MNFRASLCRWCPRRDEPLEGCRACPRFRKNATGSDTPLSAHDFCSVCVHEGDGALEIYCTRNRYYQQDSNEDFDCYQFRLAVPEKP